MEKIYLDVCSGVPRYVYTGCNHCTSSMGKSLCEFKHRGCCFYYPKFELLNIQRMAKSLKGLQILELIKQEPKTTINRFSIHTQGFFNKESYEAYKSTEDFYSGEDPKDKSLLFKACPFVKDGVGCTIPHNFRDNVCNFFICKEALSNDKVKEAYTPYLEAMQDYIRWVEWENITLQHLLIEDKLNLIDDFKNTIKFLQEISLDVYEFPHLTPIYISSGNWSKGA